MKSYIEIFFRADDFDEIYIEENSKQIRKKKKRQQKATRVEARKEGDGKVGNHFDRPLFSTHHGIRQQKKKNAEPVEVVVPYSRARKERFYFWPPYSLVSTSTLDTSEVVYADDCSSVEKKTQ